MKRDDIKFTRVEDEIEVEVAQTLANSSLRETGVVDKYFLAYWILMLQGIGFLLPYNAFISAVDYFSTIHVGRPVQYTLPTIYLLTVFFCSGIVVWVVRKDSVSAHLRNLVSFFVFLFVVLFVPVMDIVAGPENSGSYTVYQIQMALMALTGVADAVSQGSLYGIAGVFPPVYTHALQVGSSVSGTVTSVLRIITKASFSDTTEGLRKSTFVYFFLAAFVMILCIGFYIVLMHLEITKFYMSRRKNFEEVIEGKEEVESSPLDKSNPYNIPKIFREVRKWAVIVSGVYFITLLCFPGLLSEFPVDNPKTSDSWNAVILIAMFNVSDFIGKIAIIFIHKGAIYQVPFPRLFFFMLCRFAFYPLFLLTINVEVFHHEFWQIPLVLLFGFSNGYLGSICMMKGPMEVGAGGKELAGTIMVFSLVFGLSLGASLSWLLQEYAY